MVYLPVSLFMGGFSGEPDRTSTWGGTVARMTDNRLADRFTLLILPQYQNNLGKDAQAMIDPKRLPPSFTKVHPSPPAEQDIAGETDSNNARNRRVTSIPDAMPKVAGKTLGDRLHLSGLRLFKMMIIHPKAIFDLATGRLARMREQNPIKYLEELRDLSGSSNHYRFILEEGRALTNQYSHLKNVMDDQQQETINAWLGYLAKESSAEEIKDTLVTLSDYVEEIGLPSTMSKAYATLHTNMKRLCFFIEEQLEDTTKFNSIPLRNAMKNALEKFAKQGEELMAKDEVHLFMAYTTAKALGSSLKQSTPDQVDRYGHLAAEEE